MMYNLVEAPVEVPVITPTKSPDTTSPYKPSPGTNPNPKAQVIIVMLIV